MGTLKHRHKQKLRVRDTDLFGIPIASIRSRGSTAVDIGAGSEVERVSRKPQRTTHPPRRDWRLFVRYYKKAKLSQGYNYEEFSQDC